jgi:hypothetical protein
MTCSVAGRSAVRQNSIISTGDYLGRKVIWHGHQRGEPNARIESATRERCDRRIVQADPVALLITQIKGLYQPGELRPYTSVYLSIRAHFALIYNAKFLNGCYLDMASLDIQSGSR